MYGRVKFIPGYSNFLMQWEFEEENKSDQGKEWKSQQCLEERGEKEKKARAKTRVRAKGERAFLLQSVIKSSGIYSY